MGMILGFVFLVGFLVFIALIIGLVWLGVTSSRRSRSEGYMNTSQQMGQSPLDILKMRYARGEIDREEYQRRKQDLE